VSALVYTAAMRSLISLLAFAALVLQGSVAVGQAVPPGPPQYEVEVIVFANRDFDPAEEMFDQSLAGLPEAALDEPLQAPVFDESMFDAVPLPEAAPVPPIAPPADTAAAPEAPVEDPLRVRSLRAEELKLGAEYRRLRALAAYVPLLHTGWVQPGLPENQAVPFDLATVGALNPRGTVRVHLSRFLHVTLDLIYRGEETTVAASTELMEVGVAPRYRLRATRNVRSGELHYFDHPAFGVLVRVTPRAAQETGSPQSPAA
jgi:hypothetical protein